MDILHQLIEHCQTCRVVKLSVKRAYPGFFSRFSAEVEALRPRRLRAGWGSWGGEHWTPSPSGALKECFELPTPSMVQPKPLSKVFLHSSGTLNYVSNPIWTFGLLGQLHPRLMSYTISLMCGHRTLAHSRRELVQPWLMRWVTTSALYTTQTSWCCRVLVMIHRATALCIPLIGNVILRHIYAIFVLFRTKKGVFLAKFEESDEDEAYKINIHVEHQWEWITSVFDIYWTVVYGFLDSFWFLMLVDILLIFSLIFLCMDNFNILFAFYPL